MPPTFRDLQAEPQSFSILDEWGDARAVTDVEAYTIVNAYLRTGGGLDDHFPERFPVFVETGD